MNRSNTRSTMAAVLAVRTAARGSLVAATVLVLCALVAAGTPALGDSLSFVQQSGGTYWYLATADDLSWDAGDIVELTGMDMVASVTTPAGFTSVYSGIWVRWTCTQTNSNPLLLGVQSAAPAGQISYDLQTSDPSSGFVAGPEYTPEPTTVAMFCSGLMALVAVVWRRNSGAKRSR